MALLFDEIFIGFEHFWLFELVLRESGNITKYSEIKCGLFTGYHLAAAALQLHKGLENQPRFVFL